MALGVHNLMAQLGRPVGVSTALISVVPHPVRRDINPALSRFSVDFDAIGATLARQLLGVLPGCRPSVAVPDQVRIPLDFVPGASHLAPAMEALRATA
jgi:DNA-binding LacI/PurR family transcriptional regulator